MFIELLIAIGIGTNALPSDASEPTPIIDYPDPTEVMCLAEKVYHEESRNCWLECSCECNF